MKCFLIILIMLLLSASAYEFKSTLMIYGEPFTAICNCRDGEHYSMFLHFKDKETNFSAEMCEPKSGSYRRLRVAPEVNLAALGNAISEDLKDVDITEHVAQDGERFSCADPRRNDQTAYALGGELGLLIIVLSAIDDLYGLPLENIRQIIKDYNKSRAQLKICSDTTAAVNLDRILETKTLNTREQLTNHMADYARIVTSYPIVQGNQFYALLAKQATRYIMNQKLLENIVIALAELEGDPRSIFVHEVIDPPKASNYVLIDGLGACTDHVFNLGSRLAAKTSNPVTLLHFSAALERISQIVNYLRVRFINQDIAWDTIDALARRRYLFLLDILTDGSAVIEVQIKTAT